MLGWAWAHSSGVEQLPYEEKVGGSIPPGPRGVEVGLRPKIPEGACGWVVPSGDPPQPSPLDLRPRLGRRPPAMASCVPHEKPSGFFGSHRLLPGEEGPSVFLSFPARTAALNNEWFRAAVAPVLKNLFWAKSGIPGFLLSRGVYTTKVGWRPSPIHRSPGKKFQTLVWPAPSEVKHFSRAR